MLEGKNLDRQSGLEGLRSSIWHVEVYISVLLPVSLRWTWCEGVAEYDVTTLPPSFMHCFRSSASTVHYILL